MLASNKRCLFIQVGSVAERSHIIVRNARNDQSVGFESLSVIIGTNDHLSCAHYSLTAIHKSL